MAATVTADVLMIAGAALVLAGWSQTLLRQQRMGVALTPFPDLTALVALALTTALSALEVIAGFYPIPSAASIVRVGTLVTGGIAAVAFGAILLRRDA